MKVNIFDALVEHQISLDWRPRALWLRKASPVVDVANPDICVKLANHGNDRAKALNEGLRLLGIKV